MMDSTSTMTVARPSSVTVCWVSNAPNIFLTEQTLPVATYVACMRWIKFPSDVELAQMFRDLGTVPLAHRVFQFALDAVKFDPLSLKIDLGLPRRPMNLRRASMKESVVSE